VASPCRIESSRLRACNRSLTVTLAGHAQKKRVRYDLTKLSKNEDVLPTVTVVVPTCPKRYRFHQLLNHSFFTQVYPESKLYLSILEDNCGEKRASQRLSQSMSPLLPYWLNSARVNYTFMPGKSSMIGVKRNTLAKTARGSVVVHFDDDDYYGPYYVRFMIDNLLKYGSEGLKLIKLAGWYTMSPTFDPAHVGKEFRFSCSEHPNIGWGFSWVYWKNATDHCAFNQHKLPEEPAFAQCLLKRYGSRAARQIGDIHGHTLKVDTCSGYSSMSPGHSGQLVPDKRILSLYGHDRMQVVRDLIVPNINSSSCRTRWGKKGQPPYDLPKIKSTNRTFGFNLD